MSKNRKKNARLAPAKHNAAPVRVNNFGGFEAAEWSPNRPVCSWFSTDPRMEYNMFTMLRLWRETRSLYYNFPQAAKVVDDLVVERGLIMPHPATTDEEWNRLARDSFLRRFSDASRCEASGRLNWKQMQLWIELHALLDGDCLTVFRLGADHGLMVQLYAGPQLAASPEEPTLSPGCEVDSAGRVSAYFLMDYASGESVRVPAEAAHLYLHDPDPVRVRGISPLARVITGAQDLKDIIQFLKTGIKATTSLAFWESKPVGDTYVNKSLASAANQGIPASVLSEVSPNGQAPYTVNGSTIVSPLPGRRIETLEARNPTQQVHEFMADLRDDLAAGAGTDPERVFLTSRLNSAAARLNLAKGKRATDYKLVDRQAWANAVYRRHILAEIGAGRLRPCADPNLFAIRWVPDVDPTIDKGREGALMIKLIGAGLEDADAYTLATCGQTVEEIAAKRVHTLSHIQQSLPEGITLQMVLPEYFAAPGAAPVEPGGSQVAPLPPDNEPE